MARPADNLIGAIQAECNRVRETVLPEYEKIPTGVFAATMMRTSIRRGESAIACGDPAECLAALLDLRGWKL